MQKSNFRNYKYFSEGEADSLCKTKLFFSNLNVLKHDFYLMTLQLKVTHYYFQTFKNNVFLYDLYPRLMPSIIYMLHHHF